MIWLLLGCPGVDTDSPVDTDACDPGLPAEAAWEADQRGHATGLGWGDVDGDGSADLVIASGNDMGEEPISVHFGVPGALPSTAPDWQSARRAYHGHLAVGDLDHDGFDDVIATRFLGTNRFDSPGGVDLYRGGPDGLIEPPAWSYEGVYTFGATLGDVDVDGDLDLALAVGEPYEHDGFSQVLFAWDDGFPSAPTWTSADTANALDVAFVDVDGDGDLDLAQARSGTPHAVYDNDGGLATTPRWTAPGESWDGISVDFGDVSGDGAVDLLFTDNTFSGGPGVVRVFCSPDLTPCFEQGVGEAWSAGSLVDVDGDGALDVVAGQWFGPVTAWTADGTVLSRTARELVAEAFAWRDVDGSDEVDVPVEGIGLVALPRGSRVVAAPEDVAIGDGYASAPGGFELMIATSPRLDLAVSEWDPGRGSSMFLRPACER